MNTVTGKTLFIALKISLIISFVIMKTFAIIRMDRAMEEFIPKGLLHTVSCSIHCVSSYFPLFFFPIHVSVHTSQVCLFGSMSLPVSLPISTLLLVSFISVRTLNSCLSLWLGREKSCSTGQTDTFWHFGFTFSSS